MTTGHKIAMRLRAAYWSMHRTTQSCLAPAGITADQFVILALLAEEDGVTQQELVRRACSDHNTVRPMLVLLEKRHLVLRRSHPSDGRAYCIELTAEGRRKVNELQDALAPVREGFSQLFDSSEAGMLSEFLDRIRGLNGKALFREAPKTGDSRSVGPAKG